MRQLMGERMDTVDDRVGGSEMVLDQRRRELQVARSRSPVFQLNIGGGVRPGGHADLACGIRVLREDAIDLDTHLSNVLGSRADKQTGKCGCGKGCPRGEDKVIGRLDLDFARALGAGRSSYPAVRKSRAEEEGIR